MPRSSSVDDRDEVFRAPRAAASAFEVGPLFDRKGHVVDVAIDVGGGLQGDRLSADDAGNRAAHDDLSARNHSRHFAFLTYDNFGRLNVTFNLTVDLKHAATNDL